MISKRTLQNYNETSNVWIMYLIKKKVWCEIWSYNVMLCDYISKRDNAKIMGTLALFYSAIDDRLT